MRTVIADVLVAAGVLTCVLAAAGALVVREPLDRLHFLTPVTSAGTPLIGTGLGVATGWHLATATLLLCVAVVFVAGPVLASATGRVIAGRDTP
ncbi:monovalent cation/H(+) antiporter subunit G [Krasilnikovia sp. MM14-A1259]|uniref:monovalent cation/H(+) antiporter subunit G n=1 Tax=Krasilnikovia sp. MM14-A1259 TaxID=3373539 RepID=UPI0037F7CE84